MSVINLHLNVAGCQSKFDPQDGLRRDALRLELFQLVVFVEGRGLVDAGDRNPVVDAGRVDHRSETVLRQLQLGSFNQGDRGGLVLEASIVQELPHLLGTRCPRL